MQKVKLASSLKEKKQRDNTGLFLIEGNNVIAEALNNNNIIEFAVYSEKADNKIVDLLTSSKVETLLVEQKVIDKISDTETSQGVIAVAKKLDNSQNDIFKEISMIVICDEIQDPGNLGTIIRSAAAAGCTGVVISKDSADVYSPKVVRSTGGCLFKVPVIAEIDLKEFISETKKQKVSVIAASVGAKESFYNADLSKPFAVVIGNESRGVKPEILSLCDGLVSIPMKNNVESLNAGISASVIVFEAMRQRG